MSERRAAWKWAWAVGSTLAGVAAVGCANAEQDGAAAGARGTESVPVGERGERFLQAGGLDAVRP
jgi:hypothetical protein